MMKRNSVQENVKRVEVTVCDELSTEDIAKAQLIFNKYDKNRRGWIDFYDLKPALEVMGIFFHHPYVYHKMISDLKNQSTVITFYEFTKIISEKQSSKDDSSDI